MGQFLDKPMPGTKKLRRCKSQNTGKKKGDQKLLPLRQSGRFLKKFLGLQRKPVIECSEDAKYYSQPKYQPIVFRRQHMQDIKLKNCFSSRYYRTQKICRQRRSHSRHQY